MRVARQGHGTDIVWIPGGDAPAEYWIERWERFMGDFRCTSHDPRGVCETVSDSPLWTIEQFADDRAGIMRQRCDAPVILTGLSMGELITQSVSIRHPDRVRLAIPMGMAAHARVLPIATPLACSVPMQAIGFAEGSTTDSRDPGTDTDIFMIAVAFATRSTLTEIAPTGDLVGEPTSPV